MRKGEKVKIVGGEEIVMKEGKKKRVGWRKGKVERGKEENKVDGV